MTFVYAQQIVHSPFSATTVRDPTRRAHRTTRNIGIRIGLRCPSKKKHHRSSSRAIAASRISLSFSLSRSLSPFLSVSSASTRASRETYTTKKTGGNRIKRGSRVEKPE